MLLTKLAAIRSVFMLELVGLASPGLTSAVARLLPIEWSLRAMLVSEECVVGRKSREVRGGEQGGEGSGTRAE
jgi:hypothetical protein